MNPIKFSVLILVCFSPLLLYGQQQLRPLLPLDNQMIDWLAGTWAGEGNYQNQVWSDKMVFKLEMDHQFLAFESTLDLQQNTICGKGYLTIDSDDEMIVGYYANNQRDLFKGKGMISDKMISIVWYDQNQKITQLIKKINVNEMEIQNTFEPANGQPMKLLIKYNRIMDLSGNE